MFSHGLSRALLAFHGHFFVICHGHFLVYFSDESGNPSIKKKVPVTIFESPIFEKCHGQFTAFTGTFSKSFTGNQKLSRGIKQTLVVLNNQVCHRGLFEKFPELNASKLEITLVTLSLTKTFL